MISSRRSTLTAVTADFTLHLAQCGAFALCALFAAGCGQPAARSTEPAPAAAAADSGVQTITGTSPAAQGSYPSIIILEPIGGGPQPSQAVPPAMDQEQQTFIPSVLLVRTGQP